jgi:exodeoxyribonuclease V alpha subunit
MATRTRTSGNFLGKGWALELGGKADDAPSDPHERHIVVTLAGQGPRWAAQDGSAAIWSAEREVDGTVKAVTVIGALARCTAGEMLSCHGKWKRHPKYGWQFNVERYETTLPKNARGVAQWLEANVPGVGPTFAKAIVDHFGAENVFRLVDENPQRLAEVRTAKGRKIAVKQVQAAIEAWSEVKAVREIETFLFSHGVTAKRANALYRAYGEEVVSILQNTPYRITELDGFGFKIADQIALSVGVPKDDPERLKAGILYMLEQGEEQGHTYLGLQQLLRYCAEAPLEVRDARKVIAAATELAKAGKLVAENAEHIKQRVYRRPTYEREVRLAAKVRELLQPPAGALFPKPKRPVAPPDATEEEIARLALPSDEQWSVIETVRNRRLTLLTGGPGCGKTHSQIMLIRVALDAGKTVKLAAPTGKAARRMRELTGHEATTIHRLLEYSPFDGGFARDEHNPIDADLLVIDEASMLDLWLADHLFRAIGPHTHVLLVGDPDQLPPVGCGKVFDDLISTGAVPRVHLTKIFRQAAASMIVQNSRRVNRGELPFRRHEEAERALQRRMLNDFFFISREPKPDKYPDDPHRETRELILDLVCNRIPRTFKINGRPVDPKRDIMVIVPQRRGPLGLDIINKELERRLNSDPSGKPKPEIVPNRGIRVGSRIMQYKNYYDHAGEEGVDRSVMNGEIAHVLDYREDTKEALLSLDDGERKFWFPVADMDTYHLAWACSVHKLQGSEAPVCVMVVSTTHYNLLSRSLVYTGITRAKNVAVLIGENKALYMAVGKVDSRKRNSLLGQRIRDASLSGALF